MADAVWRGDAPAVAAVRSSTLGGTDPTGVETATVTINAKSVVTTVGGSTVDEAGDQIKDACNASTIPEFAELTWAYDSATNKLTATADTAGKEFTFSISTNSITMTVGAVAVETANSGANALIAANMDTGAFPGAADDLTIEQTSASLFYTLDALSAVALGTVFVEGTFEGAIGLPRINTSGASDYIEYRGRYLQLDVDNLIIGEGPGDGSARMQIDTQSAQTNIRVYKTGDSSDDQYALRLKGSHASNELHVSGDSEVDLAPDGGDTAQYAKIVATGSAQLRISRRVTVGTLDISGNAAVILDTDAAVTNITSITLRDNATLVIYGDNTVTTLDVGGSARVTDNCDGGTITTLTVGPNATYTTEDSAADAGDRTVTNTTLSPGASLLDPRKVLTLSNAIDLGLGSLADYPSLNLGQGIDIQRS